MSGYFIIQINVKNKENYKEYISKVTPIVEKFGGEYIIRGGESKNVEGKWPYERTVVLKFPNYEMVHKWHESDEYKPIKKIREDNSECNAIIIEGID
tara:strand:+ start:241 stop:531 length:291 start_codon:yes stop_codon:yes gene_type:complete